MARATGTTPLLPPNPPKPVIARSTTATIDDVIERCVSGIGPAHLFQAIIVSFAWLFDGQQTFINVFADASPSWHCTDESSASCSSLPDPCGLPESAWAWDRPPHASVISDWSLQCASSSVTGLPVSAFFAGSLVGGLGLATLSDSTLGRKNMLVLSCLATAVFGVLTAASPDVWVYSALRFMGGFSRATIGTSALVLSTELVGRKWRGEVGIAGFFCFALGFLSLPIMAYVYRNSPWWALYLWTSVPTLLYAVLIYFFVRESPRWLLVRGRREEAIKILTDIAASNGNDVATDSFSGFNLVQGEEGASTVDVFSALRLLMERRWALRRLAAVTAAGFGIGTVYYGMPLALGTLSSNLYLSVALNALSEFPSALLTFFLVGRINRRGAVLGCTLVSGACSVACVFLQKTSWVIRIGVEVVSFFCACTAYDVVLIYVMELFPTSVRNSALSMVRQAVVLGGVLPPPLVAEARREGSLFMSFGVLGLVTACCGLSVAWLPETRGGGICDTLVEQESNEDSLAAPAAGTGGEGDQILVV